MTLRNFFGFAIHGEQAIMTRILSMLDTSIDASRHVLSLVQFLRKYDYAAVNNEYKIIDGLEDQADREHRSLVREICGGSFFGGIREDLLNLLELIDNIADSAKGAGQIFHELELSKPVIDYLFKEDVEGFISTCIETAELFKKSIQALERNQSEVLSLAEQVEESEERADEQQYRVVKNLFRNEINAKSLDIVLLKDFMITADGIADNSEHGSDNLRILVAKGYT
jgi:predicted phosphate transport protein (TIGR00153 family)